MVDSIVEVVDSVVVVVVAVVVEVVLRDVVVVVDPVLHRQSFPHSGPKRLPGSGGHCSGLRLQGGSHCSPG